MHEKPHEITHMFLTSPYIPEGVKKIVDKQQSHIVYPHLYENNDYKERYQSICRDPEGVDKIILETQGILGDWKAPFIMQGYDSNYELIACAEQLGCVDEIIVPFDICDISMKKINGFFDKWDNSILDKYKFAAVVQGKSYEEVKDNYERLASDERINTLVIPSYFQFSPDMEEVPYDLRQIGYPRISILRQLAVDGVFSEKPHHFLGLADPIELALINWSLPEDVRLSIRSNSSENCFWYTLHGILLTLFRGELGTLIDFDTKMPNEYAGLFRFNAEYILMCATSSSIGDLLERVFKLVEDSNTLFAPVFQCIGSKIDLFYRKG